LDIKHDRMASTTTSEMPPMPSVGLIGQKQWENGVPDSVFV
jgi:hypothetical protein